jgi:hypothetical protein
MRLNYFLKTVWLTKPTVLELRQQELLVLRRQVLLELHRLELLVQSQQERSLQEEWCQLEQQLLLSCRKPTERLPTAMPRAESFS